MPIPEHLKSHPLFSGGRVGILSGDNPLHPAAVEASHENLVRHLRHAGIRHEETHGRYGTPERSVIVHGLPREQLAELGKKFGQESFVFSDKGIHHLQYTNGPHEGKVRGVEAGKEPIEFFHEPPEDYYTKLPGNQGYFRVNFDFNGDPQALNPVEPGLKKAEPWVSYGHLGAQGGSVYQVGDKLPELLEAAKQHGIEVRQHGEPGPGVVVVPPQPDLSLPEHRQALAHAVLHGVAEELARPSARSCYGDDVPQQQALRLAWDAGHRRRDLAHKIGLPVSDADFRRDLNTGVAEALSKLTGGQLPPGFGAVDHHIPLSVAMDHLRDLSRVQKSGPDDVIFSATRSPAVARDEKTFTLPEAAEVLKKAAEDKIRTFEAEIKELRARELKKALVPPHKHTQGTAVGAGVEDVPAGKLKQSEDKDVRGGHECDHRGSVVDGVCKVCHEKVKAKKAELSESSSSESNEGSLDKAVGSPPGAPTPGMPKQNGVTGQPPVAKQDPAINIKAELCKTCKSEPCKCAMEKAILTDSKGKIIDNGINPDGKLPGDKKEETVEASGSGGRVKTAKSLKALKKQLMNMSADKKTLSKPPVSEAQRGAMHAAAAGKGTLGIPKKVGQEFASKDPGGKLPAKKAEPPMAKPPSGKNMGTHVPVSKPAGLGKAEGEVASGQTDRIPGAAMDPVVKAVSKVVVPGKQPPPKTPSKDRDYDVKAGAKSTEYIKKAGMGMADAARRADPLSHSFTVAQAQQTPQLPKKPMPTPAEHSARQAGFASAMSGQPTFQPQQSTPRPGIFGRLDQKMGKAELPQNPRFHKPGKVTVSPTLVAPPKLKPGWKMGVDSGGSPSSETASISTKVDRPRAMPTKSDKPK